MIATESSLFAAQQQLVQHTLRREEGCSLPRGPGEFYSSDDCVLRLFCKTLGLIKMPLKQDVVSESESDVSESEWSTADTGT